MHIYLVFSIFISRPAALQAFNSASVFLFMAVIFSHNKPASSAETRS